MTPTALTPAARGAKTKPRRPTAREATTSKPRRAPAREATTSKPKRSTEGASSTSSARSAGHRSTARPSVTPRRVSGPVSEPTRTRRPPGPPRSAPRPARRGYGQTVTRGTALRTRTAAFVRSLPDHSLLDRIVRGRAWIPILGVLLAGIVAMQVETLKLSASTGRALERGTALASRNEQLRASVAVLSDDQRIESLAAGMGMVMPGPTTIKFLYKHRGDVQAALNSIHQPDATTFVASLPAASTVATSSTSASGATATVPAVATAAGTGATGAAPTATVAGSTTTPASTPTAGAGVTPGG